MLAGHGAMLAEHRPYGKLRTIHAARNAPPRRTPHERPEKRVIAENFVHGDRVRVEVEEPATPLHGGAEIPKILQPEYTPNVIPTIGQRHHARAMRQAQRPPIRAARKRLHAFDGAISEEAKQAIHVEGLPERQAQ